MPEALRLPEGRAAVKQSWDRLMTAIADALRDQYPDAPEMRLRDVAYSIACLAEQDFSFQRVGYPRARSRAAMKAALVLADQLR